MPDFYPPLYPPNPGNPHHQMNPPGSIGYSVGDAVEAASRRRQLEDQYSEGDRASSRAASPSNGEAAERYLQSKLDPVERAILAARLWGQAKDWKDVPATRRYGYFGNTPAEKYLKAAFPNWNPSGPSRDSPWDGRVVAPWFAQRALAAGLPATDVPWTTFTKRRLRSRSYAEKVTSAKGWSFPGGSNSGVKTAATAHVLTDGRFTPCHETSYPLDTLKTHWPVPGFNTGTVLEMARLLGIGEEPLPPGVIYRLRLARRRGL